MALNGKQKGSATKGNLAAFRHDTNKRGKKAKHEREHIRSLLSCASKSPMRHGGNLFRKVDTSWKKQSFWKEDPEPVSKVSQGGLHGSIV